MGWTFCIILFLYVSVCECRSLPDPDPPMHGAVQSPQYPQPYSPNLQEQWDLSVPEGYQIQITFTHLDIEASAGCHYDALTVLYDAKILEKFCGNENSADGHHPGNQPILSPGNRVTLIFQTDNNNPERHQNVGFSAQYQAIDIDECSAPEPQNGSGPLCSQICLNTLGSYLCSCHHGYELRPDQRSCVLSCGSGIFDELEGHLFSPGYPNPPPHAVSCQYIISVEPGFTVALNFTDIFHIESLQTEQGSNCLHHWLQVSIPDREPMKLCGGESPGLIVTNSNTIRLDYHTDDEGLSKGWSLDYSTNRVKCPFPGNVVKGRVTPSMTEYFYRDYIFVRCDQGYKLMMDGQEVQGFSTMCQSNAKWHLPLPACHIIDCGEPEPLLNGGVTFLSGLQNQYGSVVQYRCNEPFYSLLGGINVVFICEADRKWRSNNEVVVSPTCIPVCGQPTKLISAYQRIIGGHEAPEDTIPWQVLLSIDGARGGGMVVGDRWIMTAAHNVVHDGNQVSKETVRIFMGLTDANTPLASPVSAASIHSHPQYDNPNDLDFNHDIALIKMQDSVTFNSSIMPICLPAEGATYITGTMGLVSGFGITEKQILTNKMKYVQLPVVAQETCSDSITMLKKKSNNIPSLTNNMLCAGVPEGGRDSCHGDSGGPYAIRDDGRFWAAGIVSWGVDCGKQGTYGVYTRVTNYVDWINKTMQENHLKVRHFLLQQQRISSRSAITLNPEMGWTFCIILFLYVSVCECRSLPDPDPPMHGAVQSPQYPQPYSPNLQEQWDLSVPEGYQIQITFTHLDIEASADCHYDALTVLYDAKILGKFCGNENSADGHHPGNQPILSPGNRVTLIFQTDNNNPERHQNVGFSAQYQALDIDECSAPEPQDGSGPLCSQICFNTLGSYLCACHHGYELRTDQRSCVLSCGSGIFDELEGHLFSPGYPNPPPHAVSCQYIISVEPGFTVALNFTDIFQIESLQTEQGQSCLHHWLQVSIPDREPMKLCGGESPGLIVTNSNTIRLDYHTDDEGLSKGWSLDYSTNRVKCPFPGNVVKGRVTPSMTEYFYRDYIFVRCDQGYKLMMDGQEVQGFSTMCQSNAKWHLPLPACHIIDCGEPEPLLNGGVTFLSGLQNQYGSVVQYRCNEPFYSLLGGINVDFTCEADRKWRSNNEVVISPTCIPVCGQPTKLISAYQRIIGGHEAPEDTIPWQVLLSVDGARGGGMVVGDRWIMTAAHNVVHNGIQVSKETVRIFMGLTDANTPLASPVSAASIHSHPQYDNPNFLDFNHDIALIKMQDSVTFNSSIMPICLPAEGATYITGTMGLVSGFGITEKRILTNKMKYVQLPVVMQQTCSDSITTLKKKRNNVPNLTNNMFCAGVPEGGRDSCQGDSGGPYAIRDDGRFWAAGIVSWGVDCGKQGTYGVYTRVTNYMDWINKTMQEN
ncbi:uncharacterized protein LOC129109306 [Anoplopoma fimbria]|uniref:uncharacterized protein LOC129109306 n=1 Tax=Anoplopoma fimbria TaxID=229290 RepID=UPI0023ECF7C0|nr:uncharacterized protein LOC129109306 [Anoplopoma fimbria]